MKVVWRLTKERLSGEAFNGEGAKRFGGRWNNEGTPVVYTSESLSLAALEQFVHLGSDGFIIPFVYFKVSIPSSLKIITLKDEGLPIDWRSEPPPHSTMDIGSAWVKDNTSAVLCVPSVIIPGENNFLLNIHHADFKKIRISPPEKFMFDKRMEK